MQRGRGGLGAPAWGDFPRRPERQRPTEVKNNIWSLSENKWGGRGKEQKASVPQLLRSIPCWGELGGPARGSPAGKLCALPRLEGSGHLRKDTPLHPHPVLTMSPGSHPPWAGPGWDLGGTPECSLLPQLPAQGHIGCLLGC